MKTLLLMAAVMMTGADGPLVEGNPASMVRVVIYEDLQCPDCADFRVMLDQRLLPRFGSKVAFEHRDFPLAKHKWARDAAIASRYFAASSQDLAVRWRQYAMANQKEIQPESFRDRLAAWAKANGVDPHHALASLGNADFAAAVERDYQDGVARGIAHTPTALVNGESFVETITFEEISAAIEKALDGR